MIVKKRMKIEKNRKIYNAIKEYNGIKYTGMQVGGKHNWIYNNGSWNEIKIAPDEWRFEFSSIKSRRNPAPANSGAMPNTTFHWLIVAEQKAIKLDDNNYDTLMKGSKFKIGHKLPNWKKFNYGYKNVAYEDIMINFFERIIKQLKEKKQKREITNFLSVY